MYHIMCYKWCLIIIHLNMDFFVIHIKNTTITYKFLKLCNWYNGSVFFRTRHHFSAQHKDKSWAYLESINYGLFQITHTVGELEIVNGFKQLLRAWWSICETHCSLFYLDVDEYQVFLSWSLYTIKIIHCIKFFAHVICI